MKPLLPLLLLPLLALLADEEPDTDALRALHDRFVASHRTPELSGMTWDPDHPHGSPDWFTVVRPGIATLKPAGPESFRFPLVDVHVGDEKLLALVDTGAGVSLMSLSAAVRLGAHPAGPELQVQRGIGFGGATQMILTRLPEMTLDQVTLRHVRVSVVPRGPDLPLLAPVEGRKVEMLIGYDLLQAFNWVEFSANPRRIRLGAGEPYPGERPSRLPLLPARNGGPRIEARIAGHPPFPLTLDTGGLFGLRLPGTLAETLGVQRRDLISLPQSRTGFGGPSSTVPGEKVTLSLGAVTLQNLPTHLDLDDSGRVDTIGPLLGYPVLSRFHWVLDHDHDHLILLP